MQCGKTPWLGAEFRSFFSVERPIFRRRERKLTNRVTKFLRFGTIWLRVFRKCVHSVFERTSAENGSHHCCPELVRFVIPTYLSEPWARGEQKYVHARYRTWHTWHKYIHHVSFARPVLVSLIHHIQQWFVALFFCGMCFLFLPIFHLRPCFRVFLLVVTHNRGLIYSRRFPPPPHQGSCLAF